MTNNSGLTAIKRSGPSLPVRELVSLGLLESNVGGEVLDYGCGKGADVEFLGCDGYDPNHTCVYQIAWSRLPNKYYEPGTDTFDDYNTVLCTYVLNVVPKAERIKIMKAIYERLSEFGTAYISVRRDIAKDYKTKRGTQQYKVKLRLPIVRETKQFCIYQMTKPYHKTEDMKGLVV